MQKQKDFCIFLHSDSRDSFFPAIHYSDTGTKATQLFTFHAALSSIPSSVVVNATGKLS